MRILLKIICLSLFFCNILGCAAMKASSEANAKNQKLATINIQLGMGYLENGDIPRAKQKLLLALNEAPNRPETLYSMAYFLETTGDTAQANTYYLKAIELAPTRGDSQNNYGTYLCRRGDYQAAIQHFLLAIHDPDYLEMADAYENAGLCALKIPDKKLAIQYFKEARMQDPSRTFSSEMLNKLAAP